MYRRRGAGKMVDLINLEQDGIDDIVPNQLKVAFTQEVRNILLCASKEIVEANDLQAADPAQSCTQCELASSGGAHVRCCPHRCDVAGLLPRDLSLLACQK